MAQISNNFATMSKLFQSLLIVIYFSLFVNLLRCYFYENELQIIEIRYLLKENGGFMKIERLRRKKKGQLNLSNHLNPILKSYRRPVRLPTDFKYILKYTQAWSHYSSSIYPNGQQAFIESNCSYINCFLTNDVTLLYDFRNFDAVLFDVENNWDPYPSIRAPHQNFIFTASESADNYPMCETLLDDLYNLTWTYRLDSDIRWSYITILDKKGNTVGPKKNMKWIEHAEMEPVSQSVIKETLIKKTKAVAWFVSNCVAKSNREKVAKNLIRELAKYNQTVDIYGWCGNLQCPRDRLHDCLKGMETKYYFYLAFENSLSEDYVTEKILYPLQHYTVPIVYGGAEYSRFLPPRSYLNAMIDDAKTLADKIYYAMTYKETYFEYFRWRNHYDYSASPNDADACRLCQILNEQTKPSLVRNFRQWWNPKYKEVCNIKNNTGLVQEFHYV